MTDDSRRDLCSSPQRDRRNQRRIVLWTFVWGLSFLAVTLEIKKKWLPFGGTLAGVAVTALLGLATVQAYRRFLRETDELRRKIELEALALAFGIGVFGGFTYWLLSLTGAVPANGFGYVFSLMLVTQTAGVLIGRRRYS